MFYVQFVGAGEKKPTGCWLPATETGAYKYARCRNDASNSFLPLSPTVEINDNKIWFEHSEIPYKDNWSVRSYNEGIKLSNMIVTACHHPFLCELVETSVEKEDKDPSHTCVRLSHLEMAPKLVNGRHLILQNRGQEVIKTIKKKEKTKEKLKEVAARIVSVI